MKILFCCKVSVEAMLPMKIENRYAEHMQNFSVRFMMPSFTYGKLNQPVSIDGNYQVS